MKKYESLAFEIIDLIEKGTFQKDEKLPSIRDFATTKHVSLNTARSVYELLENEHYVKVIPQSGIYVDEKKSVPEISEIDPQSLDPTKVGLYQIATALASAKKVKPSSIDIGLSYLARDLIPAEIIKQSIDESMKKHRNMLFPLIPAPGYAPLRRQIAIYSISNGIPIDPEKLIITSGCQEAISIALTAIKASGKAVAIETPVSFTILKVLEALHIKAIEIPCIQDGGISLEALTFALDRFHIVAVITNGNFHNPTGSIMESDKKAELTKLLAQRNIPLIEDDVNGDLFFSQENGRPSTCLSFENSNNVIYCSSFSKTISPNLRLGWIYPGKWFNEVYKLSSLFSHNMSPIPQISMSLILEEGLYIRHIKKVRTILRTRLSAVREALISSFPKGTIVSNPKGGVSIWVTLPNNRSSMNLYTSAIKNNIMIAPGKLFGYGNKYESSFRLNGSALTSKEILALAKIEAQINS